MKKLKAFVLLAVIALGITAISRERSNLLRAALTRISCSLQRCLKLCLESQLRSGESHFIAVLGDAASG